MLHLWGGKFKRKAVTFKMIKNVKVNGKSKRIVKTVHKRFRIPDTPKPLTILEEPKHKYEIHDNGNLPFVVYDFGDHVDIYQQQYDYNTKKYVIVKKLFGNLKYTKLFAGDNDLENPNSLKKGVAKGNSVLLHVGPSNKYVYVGDGIREFTTVDEIVKYYSPVGNSDVPYPYAVGVSNTYFMLSNGTVKEGPKYYYASNRDLDMTTDAYAQFYTKTMDVKTYKVKVLHKRIW